MPMLSGWAGAPYPVDDAFVPITTYFDTPAVKQVPDYSLRFSVSSYSATDFAFDYYEGYSDLFPDNKVDKYLLICRYERLFLNKGSTASYYCVPWMAIPGEKIGPNTYNFDKDKFALDVSKPNFGRGFPPTADVHRGLTLRPSGQITAKWRSVQNALLNVDITTFNGDSIDLVIPNGTYPQAGEHVDIVDAVDNKVVGRVRIIFLEKLSLKAFPIRIFDEGQRFRFDRLAVGDMPDSLESFGLDNNYQHGKIVDDTNAFGFNHIGFKLDFDSTGVQLVDTNNNVMQLTTAPQTLAKITKSSLTMPDGTALPDPIDTDVAYSVLCETFLYKIRHMLYQSIKLSKFSRVFVFLTQFEMKDKTTMGLSFDADLDTAASDPSDPPRSNPYLASAISRNAGLFKTSNFAFPGYAEWTAQAATSHKPVLNQSHEFRSLVHEVSHALFVSHFFPDEKISGPVVVSPYYDMCMAHKWLRLYIKGDLPPDIVSDYDNKKLKIQDFYTGTFDSGRPETLFDRIIVDGFDDAIKDFLDKTVFGVGKRPASWTIPAAEELPFADLIFWVSLNDIVKFSRSNSIANIMDYDDAPLAFSPNPNAAGRAEAYIKQVPVWFNRFQWETLRKGAKRLTEIEKIPP